MTNQVDIGVLRGLHAASTQGEWKLHKELCKYGDSDAVAVPNAKYGWCLILSGNHNFPNAAKADAAWAVAAHNALPALLDELERLREYRATTPKAFTLTGEAAQDAFWDEFEQAAGVDGGAE